MVLLTALGVGGADSGDFPKIVAQSLFSHVKIRHAGENAGKR